MFGCGFWGGGDGCDCYVACALVGDSVLLFLGVDGVR